MTKILSVRAQIAKEWADDLETLIHSNDEVLENYLDQQREARLAADVEDEEEGKEGGRKGTWNTSSILLLRTYSQRPQPFGVALQRRQRVGQSK